MYIYIYNIHIYIYEKPKVYGHRIGSSNLLHALR